MSTKYAVNYAFIEQKYLRCPKRGIGILSDVPGSLNEIFCINSAEI